VHAVAPAAENLPVAQLAHAAPAAVNWPAPHAAHVAAAAPADWPAGQVVQAVAPVELWEVPAEQLEQAEEAPWEAWYCPAEQLVQLDAPLPLWKRPASHEAHADDPLDEEYFP